MSDVEVQRAIMAAVSPEGAIGLGGKIPWHYRGDMRRVKRLTMGTTLIMGRITSMGTGASSGWKALFHRPGTGQPG